MRTLLLLLVAFLPSCATSDELRDVSDALWSVQKELAELEKSSDPAQVARASETLRDAAQTVENVGTTLSQRAGQVLGSVADAITAPEAAGISSGLAALAALLLNLWRNRTRARDLERATGHQTPKA